jgi:hypothetical protein
VPDPVFTSAWIQATEETYEAKYQEWQAAQPVMPAFEATRSKTHNPFKKREAVREYSNGSWKGLHYKDWRKLDYNADILPNPKGEAGGASLRRKICYKNGVLGVAICWITHYEKVNSLQAVKSMYMNN